MPMVKRRFSKSNLILRDILAKLRDYDVDEVMIICNKFRQQRKLPPLPRDFLDKIRPPA